MLSKIKKFVTEYGGVYAQVWASGDFRDPMSAFIRNDIAQEFRNIPHIDDDKYIVKASCGAGRWTAVPWIAIFDKRITTSAQKGVYIVYLLNKDSKELYLTLNQAATGCTITELIKRAEDIRNKLGLSPCEPIFSGSDAYDAGCITAKKYTVDDLNDKEAFVSDLKEFLLLYEKYYEINNTRNHWWPSKEEYDPNITKEQWLEMLNNLDVFSVNALAMFACMYKLGGAATCKQLSASFGQDSGYYNMIAFHTAEKVQAYTNCPMPPSENRSKWWPILFVGRDANEDERGTFVWKVREELYEALEEFEILKHLPNAKVGKFDSWEIVDENTAIKNCDKSFFEYNGSGVPKGICWFFDADDLNTGESRNIVLSYHDKEFTAKVANDTTDRRRVRIYWNQDLGVLLDDFKSQSGCKAVFNKIDTDYFELEMKCGEGNMGTEETVRTGTVLENVIKALENIGGKGAYSEIYSEYEKITGLELTSIKKAGIRKAIETNSSDSKAFNGRDLFYSVNGVGSGIWGLRDYQTVKEKVALIKAYIQSKGFSYENELIENFYLSLKSKPFVILAGTSGTGKTRLVKLFAEAIGAQCKIVPVRPDWSDSSDLFGHVDLSGKFNPGAIIDFIKEAQENKDKPYILGLDEMNLARVEYYLSDFLSIIETRDLSENGEIVSDPLVNKDDYKEAEAVERYGELIIPENLYIVGTVNMDETTFPFSKKVLDRANTIEFSFVDLMPKTFDYDECQTQELANDFLKTEYLYLKDCDDTELIEKVCFILEQFNRVLVKANLHVGYRVRDEIVFYMLNNKKADLLDEKVALDYEIMQKILPRIQGSSAAIKDVLSELFKLCAGDYSGYGGNATFEQMNSYMESKDSKYANSAKKIAFMMRRYEEDGFTSFWI